MSRRPLVVYIDFVITVVYKKELKTRNLQGKPSLLALCIGMLGLNLIQTYASVLVLREGGATNRPFHAHNIGISHSQYHADGTIHYPIYQKVSHSINQ